MTNKTFQVHIFLTLVHKKWSFYHFQNWENTMKKMKEESKRYLTALWLAGNSTKADLQSIRMVLNATRGNIVRQLKEVQDNLTEEVHYL